MCEVNHGIFLESHPGFGGHEMNNETSGEGALHEFHRRRMAYFVRLVKIVVDERDANLWNQFRQANPTILDDVPTSGREIAWEDVDDAQAPTFGNTRKDVLFYSGEPTLTHTSTHFEISLTNTARKRRRCQGMLSIKMRHPLMKNYFNF